LTTEPFSIENNLLTPTFKLKRNVARVYYQEQINVMYEELAKKGR
jgi:long-chain acyl-CoA synthetase